MGRSGDRSVQDGLVRSEGVARGKHLYGSELELLTPHS